MVLRAESRLSGSHDGGAAGGRPAVAWGAAGRDHRRCSLRKKGGASDVATRVHVWGYPWDVAAWGVGETADMLAGLGVDALSLAVVYHEAQILSLAGSEPRLVRPLSGVPIWRSRADELPGALRGSDVRPLLDALRLGLSERGVALRAWCVVYHDAPLPPIENAFGQELGHAPCPIAGAYALPALASEVAGLGVFEAMEVESAGNVAAFHGGHHDIAGLRITPFWQVVLGLCLCQACRRLAERAGLDPDGVRSALRAGARAALEAAGEVDAADDLLARLCAAHPEVEAYAGLRAAAVVDNVVAAQGAFGGRVALVGSGSVSAERLPLLAAVTPAPPATGDVELLSLAYGEPEVAAADIARYRSLGWPADRHVVGQTLVEAAVPDRTAAEARLEAALAVGARRFSFYNIGILPPARRAWLKAFAERVHGAV
jgi:hypothetical protein